MKLISVRKVAAISVAIALLGAAGLSAPANAADTRYITISATGSTNVVPDAVRITATVSVIGKTSKEALATASTTSSAVRKALSANKIASKDVATQSVSVFPEYTYPANGTPVLSGYRASQSFDITVRAASTAGTVVDAIVDAGGDNLQVNSASPFVLDNDKATETARASAVARAKAKANSYAKLLGVKLGKVIYLDETSTPAPFPIFSAAAKAEDSATQIDLGEQKVTVSVTVRWSIG
ncbi:MAG: hypothetical protein RIR66_502 [Actinomycetota bacterium]|jgi:uncharacterized protein YggE